MAESLARPLVIGIGQPWRGDDAAGLAALDGLEAPGADVVAHHGEGLGLLALWEGRALVVLIDAAACDSPAGTLARFDGVLPAESRARSSSHAFGVVEAVETARALGRLPGRLIVHTVAGACWDLGAPLSPPVAAALPALRAAVRRDLAEPGAPPSP
ncbi:hydrogenase maturation protease [Novispirillum sp. DQ9]|uniref:hydrogenase maturation protease n=1 Tax=Novispirillum sp. DQ9 TaxID=3398612 RepID=UPI003C7984D5